MDISKTNYHKSTLNNSLGNDPKIDGAIIYANIKLINIASQPAYTYSERKFKYQQMKDLIFIYLLPALVPKVTYDDAAERYFKIKKAMADINKLESNLDYYQFMLEETMNLITIIMYNNNYYMIEDFTDTDIVNLSKMGEMKLVR